MGYLFILGAEMTLLFVITYAEREQKRIECINVLYTQVIMCILYKIH